MHITCRSPQQIRDDELVAAHTSIERDLNAMSCGYCLYQGAQRTALRQLKAQIEAEMLGEGRAPQMLWAHVYAATQVRP